MSVMPTRCLTVALGLGSGKLTAGAAGAWANRPVARTDPAMTATRGRSTEVIRWVREARPRADSISFRPRALKSTCSQPFVGNAERGNYPPPKRQPRAFAIGAELPPNLHERESD